MRRFSKPLRRIAFTLWFALMAILGASTFFARAPIYGSWWFVALWCALACCLGCCMAAAKMWRSLPSMALHGSFILILSGGLCTWLGGQRAIVTLAEGDLLRYAPGSDGALLELPQPVRLKKFAIERYPGSSLPRDYVSILSVDGKEEALSVNHPVRVGDCMLYQHSYTDGGDSIIEINRDPIGTLLSFAGYALFAAGGLLCLASPRGAYRRTLRKIACAGALLLPCAAEGAAPAQAADTMQVLYNGRAAPISTPAHEFFTKVSGTVDIGDISKEEAFLSIMAQPEKWADKKIILVDEAWLRDTLGFGEKRASLADFFTEEGEYRLRPLFIDADEARKKDILKVDERIELILKLQGGQLVSQLESPSQRLPQWRAAIEKAYYAVPWAKAFFIAAIAAGALLLVAASARRIPRRPVRAATRAAAIALLAWQGAHYASLWIAMGRVPLDNTAQTLAFASIALLALALCFAYGRSAMLPPLAMLMAGMAGLVSYLSQSDPVITSAIPVLASPWLGIHVTLVMTAYSLIIFSAAISASGLRSERGRALVLALLCPAEYLLGLGIFTGAVWASVAWGRYWAWDPKEVWALVTFMAYAVPLHRSAAFLRAPARFHAYILLALLTLLMTYFGVNYLGGLHAYA